MLICDRCGSNKEVQVFVLPDRREFNYEADDYDYSPKSYDLCKRCVRELGREITYFMTRDV